MDERQASERGSTVILTNTLVMDSRTGRKGVLKAYSAGSTQGYIRDAQGFEWSAPAKYIELADPRMVEA
ncbi:hypothetical protein [Catenulispora rubra]|uniref:hypothetical protein n=1 Tax=Catenulispora rubra TaxID=280293 RepID=UPI0018922A26|nr:hypothetical protein [Catenulispora rubra]